MALCKYAFWTLFTSLAESTCDYRRPLSKSDRQVVATY
jgi:hypothetical protein